MALFRVSFRLSGEVEVDGDDADDAREYVTNKPVEELLRDGFRGRWVACEREVAVVSVAPSAPAKSQAGAGAAGLKRDRAAMR